MSSDKLSQAIVRLFESDRFYAELVSTMFRIYDKRVPIAGVCIRNKIELHLNPDTFFDLSVQEQAAVLKHECEHIFRNHITRFKELAPEMYEKKQDAVDNIINNMKHRSMNIAADAAINCQIKNLPEGAIYPKLFDLPDHETFEWYHEQLKGNKKAQECEDIDGHELWAESEADKDLLKEKIRQTINKAAEKTRQAGKMTAEQELFVSELNKSLVNWRSQLKRFVAKAQEIVLDSSKKKRNRRYGILYPGTVKRELLRIGVAVDTSGSVSDESLKQFMTEIHNISRYATVYVVEADSEVKQHYEYNPKKKYKIKGRGGTAYKPVFDFYNKFGKIDGLIYFGDMDCFDTEELIKPKYPVLWAIVGTQDPPANFGSKIYIKES